MTRSKAVNDVAVVLTALVFVTNQQRDGCAGGLAFVDTRQNFNRIGLFALRDMSRGARLAAIQLRLNIRFREWHARWAAINHTADRRTVGFAESGNAKELANGIAGHDGKGKDAKGVILPVRACAITPRAKTATPSDTHAVSGTAGAVLRD